MKYREALNIQSKMSDFVSLLETLTSLVEVLTRQRRYDSVESLLESSLASTSAAGLRAELLRIKADFLARRGQWQKAAESFKVVLTLGAASESDYHALILLSAASGQSEVYRGYCEEALMRFGATTNPKTRESLARDCLIMTGLSFNSEVLDQLVENGANSRKTHLFRPYFELCKTLAEYRRNHFQEAVSWAHQTTSTINQEKLGKYAYTFPEFLDDYIGVEADLLLAMAQHRLHQENEARTILADAIKFADGRWPRIESGDLGSQWRDWIIAQALMKEAKRLIDGEAKKITP
jgi:tetratricopeptide (TPR) repeat protein